MFLVICSESTSQHLTALKLRWKRQSAAIAADTYFLTESTRKSSQTVLEPAQLLALFCTDSAQEKMLWWWLHFTSLEQWKGPQERRDCYMKEHIWRKKCLWIIKSRDFSQFFCANNPEELNLTSSSSLSPNLQPHLLMPNAKHSLVEILHPDERKWLIIKDPRRWNLP